MFLLVPAHPGFPGQIPQSRKTVVVVVVVVTHKILSSGTPSYLSDLLTPYAPSRLIRSTSANLLTVP